MKLAFLLTMVVAVFLPVYGQEKGPQTAPNANHAQNTTGPAAATAHASAPLIVVNQQTTQAQHNGAANDSKSYFSRLFSPENLPNIGLLIAGIAGIVVAIYTLRTIKEQAISAKASIDAVISENRPWLLLERQEHAVRIQPPYLAPIENMGADQRASYCIFFIKNYGKTPAKITMIRAELQIGDSRAEPPYKDIFGIKTVAEHPDIFPQGESLAGEARLHPQVFIRAAELDEILKKKTKFLWLCVAIHYENTFERVEKGEYFTLCCYLYETWLNSPSPMWVISGISRYNSAS
jgi:hypothetical protein